MSTLFKSESRSRWIVNSLLVVAVAALYGFNSVPIAILTMFGVLLLEFVILWAIDWYFGGTDC